MLEKFDVVAVRGPVPVGSIADIVIVTQRNTAVNKVNSIFKEESRDERYLGIVGKAENPLVSSNIIGDAISSIIDPSMTRVVGGDLVKIMSWYDNKWEYSAQMVREAIRIS